MRYRLSYKYELQNRFEIFLQFKRKIQLSLLKTMNKETLAYLQQDGIGKVIAKGLASVYTQKPNKPIKYLADWLKNYSQNQKQLKNLQANAKKVQTNLKIYESNLTLQAQQEKQKKIQQQKYQQHIDKFKQQVAVHEYQEQLLYEDVCEFLQKLYNFTGVYIGELNHPKRNVTDQDTEENAHLDLTAPKMINYIGSSKSHKDLMIGKTLPLDKGVTAKAFQLSLQDSPQQIGQDGLPIPQQKKEKCVYIPNVVKNQNMHYFRLPKLGAYVAVPLIYSSYLKENIFDTALAGKKKEISDQSEFEQNKKQALEEMEKQIDQILVKINELKEKNTDEAQIEAAQQQLKRLEEKRNSKNAQKFQYQGIELPTQKQEYVICADNLGSDKQISESQRQFMIEFALHFKNAWEKKQYELLYKDVETQIQYEKNYLDVSVEQINAAIEAQLQLDEETKIKMGLIEDENLRNYQTEGWRIDRLKKYIVANQKLVKSFEVLKNFRVVKFKELIQNILYFQGKRKSQINFKGKACIDWKNVRKNLINKQLFNNVLSYVIEEQKTGEYPPYAKINSIIQKLESFSESEVLNYNIGLGMLKKYIERVLKHRINNIQLRKIQKQNERIKREEIIEENAKITEEKIRALQAHKLALSAEEVETFSEEQWSVNYDQEHPLLEVPPEVVPDVDNDF